MTENENKDAVETNPESAEEAEPATTATEEPVAADEGAEEAEEPIFVEDPSFEIDYKGDCAYEVKVSIPPANRKKQAEDMFDELKQEAEVPGFRRGKAPRKLIERKFAKAVRSEVDAKLVSAAFDKLITDKDLHPIASPDIDGLEGLKDIPEDQPITLTFKFEVGPRVELGKYRGIEVERPVVSVDEKDVDEAVEEQRQRMAVFETVADAEAKEGDQVIIDFKGTVDGVEFAGGSAENYPYILGTRRFFAEFEDALQGAKAGDEKECDVTFADNYPNADLQGKTAHFTIKVKEIKRRQAPELTDELAQQFGYESIADMREKFTEQMRAGSAAQSDRIAEARALEKIIEDSKFEIPNKLIENLTDRLHEEEVRRLLSARVPLAQVRERDEELRAHAREHALNEIKSTVVLNEIAEAEGLEVTDEDFEQEAHAIADRTGLASTIISQYIREGEERSSYESRILRAKALRTIIENAQVTDKELPREEMEAQAQAAEHQHDHDHDHEH
jgi:trigger factor